MQPRRVARLAVFALLGPITGPLAAGIFRHYRTAPVLAALYAAALILLLVEMPATLGALLAYDLDHSPALRARVVRTLRRPD